MSTAFSPASTRHFRLKVLTAAITASLFAPLPAIAQDADAAEAGDDMVVEEVVVTGIRRSLDDAAEIKRGSDSIVDAITAEDIGLFSDNNIAEALQRVPGVQVERSEGEGFRISIRGLGPRFVRTTLNGRTALSSPGGEGGSDARGFSFSIIPSEVVSRAEVAKSSQAMDIEGGIGGTVNLVTNRALDFAADREESYYFGGAVRGTYNEFGEDWSYRGSIFYNQKLGDNFAFFLSAVVDSTDRLQDTTETQDFQIEGNDSGSGSSGIMLQEGTILNGQALTEDYALKASIFDGIRNIRRDRTRDRGTITGGFQWQPTENWDINFDWTHAEIDEAREDSRSWLRVEDALDRLNDRNSPTQITNITVDFDDADEYTNGTVTAFDFTNFTEDRARQTADIANLWIDSEDTVDVGGINAKWSKDAWMVAFDVGYASQERTILQRRMQADVDFSTQNDPARFPLEGLVPDDQAGINGSFDITSGIPIVRYYDTSGVPFDVTDATDLNFDQDRQGYTIEDNTETSFRFDVAREIDWSIFDTLYAGYSYRDREGFRTDLRTSGDAGTRNTGEFSDIKIAQYGTKLITGFMDGINNPDFNHSFITPDFAGWIAGDPVGTFANAPEAGILRQDISYEIGEDINAFYLQAAFAGGSRFTYRGNVGLRYADTDQFSTGALGVQEGDNFEPLDPDNPYVTTNRSYDDWLPSFNIAWDFTQNVIFRLAYSKTVSRPDPVDLRQGWDLDKDIGEDNVGKSGNPDLEPYRSDNYDAILEWYPESGGAYALGLFYKKLDGFISDGVEYVDIDLSVYDPELGVQEYEIQRPVNTDGGDIKGVEFAMFQPFDAFTDGFWSYFGMNASVTYVDAKLDAVREGTDRFVQLRGTSEWSGNIVGYFEKGPFGARLAYNYRDNFLHQEAISNKDFDEYTDGGEYVDFNMDWRFNRHWRVRFSANNVTDTQRYRYFQTPGKAYMSGWADDGRTYVLELRGNM